MPAYVIGRLESEGWKWLREYGPPTARLIAKHGGKYLVRGGAMERLEGERALPDAFVMLEFPTLAAARAWYHDPEYAPLRGLRQAHALTELVLVDGFEQAADALSASS
jgi:uncharacterized protein (DUF1330 family)